MISRELHLRTARLLLRPTTPHDADRLFEIQSDWEVTRMLRLAAWPPDREAMRLWVAEHADEWRRGEAFRFAVIHQGRLIGQADIDEVAAGEGYLGYWLERPAWGAGLATEAARALVQFAVARLGVRRLKSGHAADNPASGRVLEKLGFTFVDEALRPSRPRGGSSLHRHLELRTPLDFAT